MRVTPLVLLACVVGGALVGATYDRIPGTSLNDERLGRDLVLKQLPADPDAAFRNLRTHATGGGGAPIERVCGEVAGAPLAKSAAQYRRFVADLGASTVRIEPDVRATRADVAAKLAECQSFETAGWSKIARQCDHDAKSLGDDATREAQFEAVWTAACLSPPPSTTIAGG